MQRILTTLVVSCAIVIGAAADARAQKPEQCIAALKALKLTVPPENPCDELAGAITAKATEKAALIAIAPDPISQRDLQSRAQQATALGGTAAQGQAIPSVQPAGVAAGTIAAFGTNTNQEAMAALSINPAVLFLGDLANKTFAKASRLADITVFVPVSTGNRESAENGTGTTPSTSNRLRYFGARVRLNVNGISAGDEVFERARELAAKFTNQTGTIFDEVTGALATAPNADTCGRALFNNDRAGIVKGCGRDVVLVVDLDGAERLREQFALVRRKADSRYFGADIRMDFGDPTLGAVEDAAGRFLFGGFAAGARKDAGGADGSRTFSVGVRGRLGVRHAKLDAEPDAELAFEWGAGLEIVRYLGDDEVNVSLGFEGRHGNAEEALFLPLQTNVVMARFSFSLPLTTGNHVGINLGYPVAGRGMDHVSPTFSVTLNWGLLLSKEVRR